VKNVSIPSAYVGRSAGWFFLHDYSRSRLVQCILHARLVAIAAATAVWIMMNCYSDDACYSHGVQAPVSLWM